MSALPSCQSLSDSTRDGELIADPNGILDLPRGFSYQIISRMGDTMDDGFRVPGRHDGMVAFSGPHGSTILVRNHEMGPDDLKSNSAPFGASNELLGRIDPAKLYDRGRQEMPGPGGTTTLIYNTSEKRLESHFLSLAGTHRNCAGGPTPWQSWISCEETVVKAEGILEKDHGYNFEVPASASMKLTDPIPLKAMGRFNHEAVAIDPKSGFVYQTEDRDNGLLYRFLPHSPGKLDAGGRLQALRIVDSPGADTRNWSKSSIIPVGVPIDVTWIDLTEVESPNDDLRLQGFNKGAALFANGEGMIYAAGAIYFVCTDGGHTKKGQIWRYLPNGVEAKGGEEKAAGRLELYVESRDGSLLENIDNLTLSPWGDLIVCEDRPKRDFLIGITPAGQVYKIARNALNESEFAGATFSPNGSTLFVNIQTPGFTLAIVGPWSSYTSSFRLSHS